jgi:hypothetical protein
MNTTLIATTAALLALATVGATAPAQASGRDDVRRSGSCSGATDWKIKAKPDDGRIEVEAEIDSNRVGQAWRWTLRHDGAVADRGRATTQGPSGSFSVHRRTGNSAGADAFRFIARNPASGERCVARVSL